MEGIASIDLFVVPTIAFQRDAPCRRPVERFGDIVAYPVLGDLHHRYARI
jgi:hypothetical protein